MGEERKVLKLKDCQYREATYEEKESIITSLDYRPNIMKSKVYNDLKNGNFLVVDATCTSVEDGVAYFETEYNELTKGQLKELGTGNFQINSGSSC